jgi:alpha-amylase
LEDKSPHDLYEHADHNGLRILTRNPSLSDDIAFRVAESYWNITAQKYLSWLEAMPDHHSLVTVAIDYETFGEHHKPETGILNFLENLLLLIAIQNSYIMATPVEVAQKFSPKHTLHIPDYVAVSGAELADWVGNEKQREAFAAMMALELRVKKLNDPEITKTWRHLQASDHFYYMSDKDVQLSPYASSQEAFDNYMKALKTLSDGIQDSAEPEKSNEALEAERRTIDAPVWALNIEPHSGFTS